MYTFCISWELCIWCLPSIHKALDSIPNTEKKKINAIVIVVDT